MRPDRTAGQQAKRTSGASGRFEFPRRLLNDPIDWSVGPNLPVIFLKNLLATHLATLLPRRCPTPIALFSQGRSVDRWSGEQVA
jgi:hypothetical protein